MLLEEELFRDYQDFCFTFLWPITHNVAMFMHSQANKTFNFQNRDWLAYKQANEKYAEAVFRSPYFLSPQAMQVSGGLRRDASDAGSEQ